MPRDAAPVRYGMTDDSPTDGYWSDAERDIQFPDAPETREGALFDGDEEDTLFDAYQMLRYAGVPKEKLWPMVMVVETMTIYDRNSLEHYYQEVLGAPTIRERAGSE